MKKIYLLSGPGTTEGYSPNIVKELKKDLKDAKTIAFIASSPTKHEKNMKYVFGADGITGIVNHLKEAHSFEKISVIDDKNKDKSELINVDVIYLLGGNYETQLDFIKENKFDVLLQNFNGIILGTSCGAMNLASKGYYSKDEDIEKSFLYDGLGIIDLTIDPHFDINNSEQIDEALKMSTSQKIYGVPNDSCIKITQKKVNFIGKIYIFESGNMTESE